MSIYGVITFADPAVKQKRKQKKHCLRAVLLLFLFQSVFDDKIADALSAEPKDLI